MSYFEMFPSIHYDAKGNKTYTQQKNLMARLKLTGADKNNILNFDYYDIQDGDTPESIAFKYYNNTEYHWTILIANDIIDYYDDWPMSVQRFEEYVNDKYDNAMATHHYEISQTSGDTTITIDVGMNGGEDTDYPSATSISNYQYEESVQEKKRQIRLIQQRFIEDFVEEFRSKLKEGPVY